MTRTELIDKIKNGNDILLDVLEAHLVIFTWCDEGIGIGKQNDDIPLDYYESAEDLVDNYKVNGFPLSELSNVITISDYT